MFGGGNSHSGAPREIVVLVACTALHSVDAIAVRPASDVHCVAVAIVSLPGIISLRMAIHAAWIVQHGNDGLERSGAIVPLCASRSRNQST